jgi:hypothetical protein
MNQLLMLHNVSAGGRRRREASLATEVVEILRDASSVERECRLAILTSFLPEDEFIGRMRASIIAAESRKAAKP